MLFDQNNRQTEIFGDRPTPHSILAVLRRAGGEVGITATAWRMDARYDGSGETFDDAIAAVAKGCPWPLPQDPAGIRETFAKLQFAWKFRVKVTLPDGAQFVTDTAYPETGAQQLAEWHLLRENGRSDEPRH